MSGSWFPLTAINPKNEPLLHCIDATGMLHADPMEHHPPSIEKRIQEASVCLGFGKRVTRLQFFLCCSRSYETGQVTQFLCSFVFFWLEEGAIILLFQVILGIFKAGIWEALNME